MYNSYGYDILGSSYGSSSALESMGTWTIVALILSLVGCFLVYFLFVTKDAPLNGKFLPWLREFLRFNKMLIEPIMKIAYIFIALFITLSAFALISYNFVSFLLYLVFGNIIARVLYEATLIVLMIWKNTTEIKNNMKK